MIVVFGTSRHVQHLGAEQTTCAHCGATSFRERQRHYGVFHLFFFPLFPTRERVEATCTACGWSEAVRALTGSSPIPVMHRFGYLGVLAVALGLFAAMMIHEVGNLRARAEAASRREAMPTRTTDRLALRLVEQERWLAVGKARGADDEAQEMANAVARVLSESWTTDPNRFGVYVAIIHSGSGKRILVLTDITQSDPRAADFPVVARPLAEALTSLTEDGTWVSWSILRDGKYVATLSGPIGGRWYQQTDPIKARELALQTMNYDGR